jgi:hypothetical protein
MDSTNTVTEDVETAEVVEAGEVADTPSEHSGGDIPTEVKRALQKANKEAETLRLKLRDFEDRDKTDAQKLQEERDALRAERDLLFMEQLRREVADEKGLTPAQARRLVGATREELLDDADDVITTFQTKTVEAPSPDLGQGSRSKHVNGSAQIRSVDELNHMSEGDILAARKDGRLDALMGKQ